MVASKTGWEYFLKRQSQLSTLASVDREQLDQEYGSDLPFADLFHKHQWFVPGQISELVGLPGSGKTQVL